MFPYAAKANKKVLATINEIIDNFLPNFEL